MERRHFVKEIGIVKTLERHSNIADILGLCCNSSELIQLFIKTMTGKTLKQHLLKTRESVSDITAHNEILREYAEQICNGMLFLSNQGFCHPSLRCESVHVDKKGVCKLYDFTPVELCGIKDGYNQDLISHELVAPEIVKGESHTPRTDVWAFGNLLWELFFYGFDASKMFEDVASQSYVQLIGSREKPIACPDAICRLLSDDMMNLYKPAIRRISLDIRLNCTNRP
ncbi:putative tyrosine-protein kinase [Apostichopus japonicus]|uniref:Putative tyrosine-protein kinase n=1 Tax=Stichopus japonicus TaxID=307972 RepID=A0A2G8JUC3_STIJA|nr:putative tyrosine-protein kinase [Apostichopus japonicus]